MLGHLLVSVGMAIYNRANKGSAPHPDRSQWIRHLCPGLVSGDVLPILYACVATRFLGYVPRMPKPTGFLHPSGRCFASPNRRRGHRGAF